MRILVTRGHRLHRFPRCSFPAGSGHDVVVIDNLVNSSEESLRRVAELALAKNNPNGYNG